MNIPAAPAEGADAAAVVPADVFSAVFRSTLLQFETPDGLRGRVMSIFMLAATLLVGLTSYVTRDQDREWWARSGGLLLAVSAGWVIFAGVVLYGPLAIEWLNGRMHADPTAALGVLTGVLGWIAAHLGSSSGTPSGRRKDEPSGTPGRRKSVLKEWGAALLSPAFVLLLAVLMSMLNMKLKGVWSAFFPAHGNWPLLDTALPALWLALGYGVVCMAASFFINVNTFSLHSMYRERLIRAYLGASNENRSPHWFTGFDENDNLPMCGPAQLIVRPSGSARRRSDASSRSNPAKSSDWAPSDRARSGVGWTSMSNPSAPAASAARAIGGT